MASEVIIHYDEIGLKGKNRPHFEKMLCSNVRSALRGVCSARIRPLFGRLILRVDDQAAWPRVRQVLRHVYGIANFGRVWEAPLDLDAIAARALEVLPDDPDATFGVRAKRADKVFPVASPEICRILGAAIQQARGWRVDLGNPDITVYVTMIGKRALISWEKVPGPGGLPAGISATVTCLLSGGIDSPVAAHRIMRRGASPVFLHFHSYPFTEKSSQEIARRLAQILLRGQPPSPFWLVPLGEIQQRIIAESLPDLRVVLYRRFMMRLASRVARHEGAQAIVTGEALGQVASQTLENMSAIEACIDLPVLRPLIGFDKREIVAAAKELGTYEERAARGDDCCSFLLPPHPATRASAEELLAAEAELPVESLLDDAMERSERTTLTARFDADG